MFKGFVSYAKSKAMSTKLFWKLYFWWSIREARKRRLATEARHAALPKMTHDEYWEHEHMKNKGE